MTIIPFEKQLFHLIYSFYIHIKPLFGNNQHPSKNTVITAQPLTEMMQHMTRVLHSTHIFLFSWQRSFGFGMANIGKRILIPQLLSSLDVDNASYYIYDILPHLCLSSCHHHAFTPSITLNKHRYSTLVNQRAFQTVWTVVWANRIWVQMCIGNKFEIAKNM